MGKNKKVQPGCLKKSMDEIKDFPMKKNGEFKFKKMNKVQKKLAKSKCSHQKKTKSGKFVPFLFDDPTEKGVKICARCGARIRAKFYSPEERKALKKEMNQLLNQTMFLAGAVGANEKAYKEISNAYLKMDAVFTINERETEVAQKQATNKKKNKKNFNNGSSYGKWQV